MLIHPLKFIQFFKIHLIIKTHIYIYTYIYTHIYIYTLFQTQIKNKRENIEK